MLFDHKHRDIETGKYDTDKLRTLNSSSLTDLMDTIYDTGSGCYEYTVHRSGYDVFLGLEEMYNAYMYPEREKELQKKKKEQAKKEKKEAERESLRRARRHQEMMEERERFLAERDAIDRAYQQRVREREAELRAIAEKEMNDRLIYLGGPNSGRLVSQSVCNVRPNSWKAR